METVGPIELRQRGRKRLLSSAEVQKIRHQYQNSRITLRELAGQYAVSHFTVSQALKGRGAYAGE